MAKKTPSPTFDFVVVSNRLPVSPATKKDGSQSWVTTPGGLVAALAPVMKNREAAWVGWPGLADVEPEPFTQGKTHYVPVSQSEQELVEFYEGFSNATIWPLYHDLIVHPEYHREWWDSYRRVNTRFAEAAAETAAQDGFVWVHDYQLQLVPQMLRKLRPDVKIGYFHHIPFPAYDLFAQLPWRDDILNGLLGADVVGFQRESDAANMRHAISQSLGYSMQESIVRVPMTTGPKRDRNAPPTTASKTRQVTVDAFPISLDQAAMSKLAQKDSVVARAKEIRAELGKPKTVFLGVDRLDYTKGIRHRFKAFGEMLAEGTVDAKDVVFVQLASPSRERVESYKHLRDEIEIQVGRINGEFGHVGRPAIVYLHQNISREEMVAMYLAADVMVVTPLRDGMNLVAKEFVASRNDDSGVLVLSEFAGAADELDRSLLVNPHDIDGLKATFAEAAAMPKSEKTARMQALRKVVEENDVKRWATSFLDAVAPSAPVRRR